MDLDNKTLDEWLAIAPLNKYLFNKKIDFSALYLALKFYLNNIHKDVTSGANLIDKDLLLNDHGPDHIDKVIERASMLVSSPSCELTAREVFILLCSIQIHDIGNILGRYQHDKKIQEVLNEAKIKLSNDDIQQNCILQIAEAHGGTVRGTIDDKDKIKVLKQLFPVFGDEIRQRLLASILRFADELADDKSRASSYLLKNKQLPRKSEIFHAYAYVLDSVLIKHELKTINFYFHIPISFALIKFGKPNSANALEEVFLIDEIYNRTLKAYLEMLYCMRFSKGCIDIEKILVSIDFYSDHLDDKILPPITYELEENGFPKAPQNGIFDLCPSLLEPSGLKIDGKYIFDKLNKI